MEKIDILLATYNGEEYLSSQIDSILYQTYQNIELIIRDDGSSDNTCKIIKEYLQKDSRVKFIKDGKKKLGFVRNFEELMKHSNANYIMFSDQDDIWLENKIETTYNFMKSIESKDGISKAVLVHSDSIIMNFDVKTNKLFISKYAKNKSFETLFFNYFVQGSSCMINKKLKDESLEFPQEVYLHDRYLHLISEMLGQRYFIEEPLMYYRQHTNNQIGSKSGNIFKLMITSKYFIAEDRELIMKLYKKYGDILSPNRKEKIIEYFKITDISNNRIKRFLILLKNKIPMKISKKIFLLIKG